MPAASSSFAEEPQCHSWCHAAHHLSTIPEAQVLSCYVPIKIQLHPSELHQPLLQMNLLRCDTVRCEVVRHCCRTLCTRPPCTQDAAESKCSSCWSRGCNDHVRCCCCHLCWPSSEIKRQKFCWMYPGRMPKHVNHWRVRTVGSEAAVG